MSEPRVLAIDAGGTMTEAIVLGSVDVEKPALPSLEPASGPAPTQGTRPVHWGDGYVETNVLRMEAVGGGQTVEGPAILESPATTFAVPPRRRARLDENQIFHMEAAT